jgi:hypothetical protein
MKTMLAIGLSFISLSVFACPNFSGEYVNEEFGTYYSIAQDGCDTISYIYDEGTVDSPIDGKEYLINEYDIVVEEGKVLAHVAIYESDSWKDSKLITKQRSETTYTSGGVDKDSGWSESFLDKDTNLVSISHGANGVEKTIDKRVK